MSASGRPSAASSEARAIARDTKKIIRNTRAALTGRERTGNPVRRSSYDVDDRRAKVFVRIDDGTKRGGLGFVDDIVQLAEEYDIQHKQPGERWPLGSNAVRVLKIMLTKFLRFRDGQLDPSLATLVEATKLSRNAVIAALKKLAKHKFLAWVRRSYAVEDAPAEFGTPQRKQATNAYHFTLDAMNARARARWRQLRERRRRRLANAAPITPPHDRSAPNAALAAALARAENAIDRRDAVGRHANPE